MARMAKYFFLLLGTCVVLTCGIANSREKMLLSTFHLAPQSALNGKGNFPDEASERAALEQADLGSLSGESLVYWYGRLAILRHRADPKQDRMRILQELSVKIHEEMMMGKIPEEKFAEYFFPFQPRLSESAILIPRLPSVYWDLNKDIRTYPELLDESQAPFAADLDAPRYRLVNSVTSRLASKMMLIVGIAGGTGSGKSTQAQNLAEDLRKKGVKVQVISTDDYLIPRSQRKQMGLVGGLETHRLDLLKEHIECMKKGIPFVPPKYNHETGEVEEGELVDPSRLDTLIIEGQFPLAIEELRNILDIKIYIDEPDLIRFGHRLERDPQKRGYTWEDVAWIFITSQTTEYLPLIKPSAKYCDILVEPTMKRTWLRWGFSAQPIYSVQKRLHGGTPAKTFLVKKFPGGNLAVVKSASWEGVGGNGIPWVLSQARYMQEIRQELGPGIVPEVTDIEEHKDGASYVMQYLEGSTTEPERLLSSSATQVADVLSAMDRTIDFVSKNLYTRRPITPKPAEIRKAHLQRIEHRMGLVLDPPGLIHHYLMKNKPIQIGDARYQDVSKMFRDLLSQDTITINGRKYHNLATLLATLAKNESEMLKRLGTSHFPVYVHGDFSWRNALRLPDGTYRLIDMRGRGDIHKDTPSDISIEYEVGKLVHSLTSDFLERDLFDVDVSGVPGQFEINAVLDRDSGGAASYAAAYGKIYEHLRNQKTLRELLGDKVDPWIRQIKLAEAAHYAANIINRINEDPFGRHALMYYVFTIVTLSNFLQEEGILPIGGHASVSMDYMPLSELLVHSRFGGSNALRVSSTVENAKEIATYL